MKRIAALLLAAAPAFVCAQASDAALRELLARRVDCDDDDRALVVAVIEKGVTRTAACGGRGEPPVKVTLETAFDGSSLAPLLQGVLLAEMAGKREVRLEDPASKYLPAPPRGTKADNRTLQALALQGDPTLALVLAARAKKPAAALLREKVLAPLEMAGASSASEVKLAMRDVMRFASANLTASAPPMLAEARKPRTPLKGGSARSLGWVVDPASKAAGYQGAVAGESAYLYVDPVKGRAVAVFANYAGHDTMAIGAHLVDPAKHAAPDVSIRRDVWRAYKAGGVPGALDRYSELKATRDDSHFEPGDLEAIGARLLRAGKAEDALALLVLDVVSFPNAPSAHEALGQAYLAVGRNEEAIASLAQALQLAVDAKSAEAPRIRERYEAAVKRAHSQPRAEAPALTPNAGIPWK